MKRIEKLFLIVLMALPLWAVGQEARMEVKSRQSAVVGQQFQIVFEVNARASDFKMPTLRGLTLLGGPSVGRSTSITGYNGQMTTTTTYSYTIYVMAESEGTANVGAASCTVGGKTVSSRPFSIRVDAGGGNAAQGGYGGGRTPNQPQGNQPQGQQVPQATTIDNTTLFARASINKTNLYQGEEAIIVYKIYTQVPLTQFQIEKLPRIKGFWSEDLSEGQTQVKQYTETYNGRQYQVAEIRRGAIYAQENGALTIAPLQTDVVAIVQTQRQRQRTGTILDFFIDDPFFAPMQQQSVVKSLTSNSLKVNVKPLPDAPAGFGGGVGRFSIKAESDMTELTAGEALTFRITVSGRGNLSLLEAPNVVFPKGLEAYEPRVVDKITKGDNGLSGSRTFEWIVTPQTQGNYEIGPVEYVYFDPNTGQYVTLKSETVKLKVAKGSVLSQNKSSVEELNSDIHHIRKSTRLYEAGSGSRMGLLFWLLMALPVAAAAAVAVVLRRRQHIAADEGSMRLQRATKLAKQRLREAERHMKSGNEERFYEEIYKALWGGIADKFNIQLSLLSTDTVKEQLESKGVDAELKERILRTLADVDFARFAPGDASSKERQIYDEAMATIIEIGAIKVKGANRAGSVATAVLALAIATSMPVSLFAAGNGEGIPSKSRMGKSEAQALFQKANEAYESGNYDEAIEAYTAIREGGYESWELYYNMGNTYYRMEELGQSVLNYERSLRLAPGKKIVEDNLALANSHTADKIEVLPDFFLKKWIDSIAGLMAPRGWRVMCIVFIALLSVAVCIFVVSSEYRIRRRMFVVAAILLLVEIFSLGNAAISTQKATNRNEAVVLSPMIVVKGSPDRKSVDKFVLHEGTKLNVTDRQDDWCQIEIADGKSGWIEGGIEAI